MLGPAGLGYVNASKGEKPALRAFLSRHHEAAWFAAIAASGQKHGQKCSTQCSIFQNFHVDLRVATRNTSQTDKCKA